MAKTRDQKEELLNKLDDKISRAKVTVLMKYQGLKVSQTEELRSALRKAEIDMIVPKNSVAKIALKKHGIEVSGDAFDQPLAMIFGYTDEVQPAKELVLFAKTYEAVEILGGILDTQVLDAKAIKALAALPSREQLLAQMAGSIVSPLRGLVTVLSGVPRGLVTALNQIKEQKEKTA